MEEPTELARDRRIRVSGTEPVLAIDGGLQPFLFCSSRGTLVVQSQLPERPFGTKRKMTFSWRLGTAVSRDGGRSWQRFVHEPGKDEVNLEGGVAALGDGTILALDTYVVPRGSPGRGVGELWVSRDDWRSLEGPADVDFELPRVVFDASSDDGGHPHRAARLHRSILEPPGGELIGSMYAWYAEDTAPNAYMPSMKKTRSILVRSADRGRSWRAGATIAADSGVGTEGFGEPVVARVTRGECAGRLVCLMRTGGDLYGCHSDDDGASWSPARPVSLPGVDIYDTPSWEARFAARTDDLVKRYPWMQGSVVDPDLVEMRSGVLACAVGVRIPERACWGDDHPLRGAPRGARRRARRGL
jgi:hypothetical protein